MRTEFDSMLTTPGDDLEWIFKPMKCVNAPGSFRSPERPIGGSIGASSTTSASDVSEPGVNAATTARPVADFFRCLG